MADLAFTVDFNQLKAANAELERTGKVAKTTTATYNSAFQKAIGWQVRFQNEQAKVSAKLEETYRKQTLANKSARESANVYKEAAAAAAIVAKEEERLKNKFVEGYTAMNIYTKELNDLAVARKRGLIGTKEQAAAVAQLNAQMKAGTGVFANAATGMQLVGKRANRTGMLAQQAGYQFGDFAVQVQSGTNPMVAFGQQATQLIGTFSMLAKSTKAIMAFSALGVIVPIITGLAAAFMRTREEAKEAEVQLNSTSEMLKELRTSSSDAAKELRVLLGTFKDIADLDTFLKIEAITEKIAQTTLRLDEAKRATGSRASGQAALQEKIDTLNLEIESLKTSNDKRLANEKLLEIEKSYRELMGEILEESQKEIDAAEKLADKRKESIAAFQEQLVAQSEVLTLLELEKQFGKDSSAYRAELVAQEVDRLNKLLDQKEITGQQAEDALRLYEETLKVTGEMDASANSAKGLADALKEAASAMASLSSFGDSLDKALAVSLAKVQALKSGADAAIAGTIAGMRADLSSRAQTGLAAGVPIGTLMSEIDSSSATISQIETSETERKRLEAANRKSNKGGGSKKPPSEELQEYLDKLQQQSELESKLVGLFGEKRNTEEEVIKARQKYGEVFGASQEAELRGTLAQIEADKERQRVLEEAKQQQQSIADTLQSSMSDAFMSMVDGTKSFKDAMKDMARAVIKQLFEVLVVQRLVGSFDSKAGKGSGLVGMIMGAFQANGGAWQGGSQIQAYANGGVVGGPTMFPMAGGKTGLMGEAGPEAIMPLKRGANGKLGVQMEGGGGSSVVVNQSFNFSANGDDSVKKIIAQAAPQIANMTKKSIIDDRRRGGQMKATFG